MMKKLMIGNEAIARGAYEAGVTVATAYPGTPSTEIVSNLARFEGVYAERAPNEKVALEVGAGASIGSSHPSWHETCGVNVAADPLYTFAIRRTGARCWYQPMTRGCIPRRMNRITAAMRALPSYPFWNPRIVRKPGILPVWALH